MAVKKYLNRELSWLQFNSRVLAEAQNPSNPLGERLKFLAIHESNLDEFFMVRVSGLWEQAESGSLALSPDGLTADKQLAVVMRRARKAGEEAARTWAKKLRPELARANVRFLDFEGLPAKLKQRLRSDLGPTVKSVCMPLMVSPPATFPFISNRSLNLAVELADGNDRRLARIKLPTVVPQFFEVPGRPNSFVLTEDLVRSFLPELFPGYQVVGSWLFRVIRDADVEIKELEASDLFGMVEETLRLRRFGAAIRLEVEKGASEYAIDQLREGLELDESDVFVSPGRVGFDFLWQVVRLTGPVFRFPRHEPFCPAALSSSELLFDRIRSHDLLLHHPYDSFDVVDRFVGSAANDPKVLGIRMTLYRVGTPSSVVQSLMAAAEAGKQVGVMLELKARFDEGNNLEWAKALEKAGAHVSYGVPDLKVHSKMCLVVRQDEDGIRSYGHIGTGNYNATTARLYTDLGLMTCDPDVTADMAEMFNFLTGYSKQSVYRRLLVAPFSLREAIVDKVHAEIAHARAGRPARAVFKVNSLVDPEVIDALYEASAAGVHVDLVVRGICCLRPGVKGLSDNIRVRSVVGRFLEHARVYWFAAGGTPEAWIGSADVMRRNLDRRTEVLVPLRDPAQIDHLLLHLLEPQLRDTLHGWAMDPSGKYDRATGGSAAFDSQAYGIGHSALRLLG